MTIKKKELRDFIYEKTNTKVIELERQKKKIIIDSLEPFFKEVLNEEDIKNLNLSIGKAKTALEEHIINLSIRNSSINWMFDGMHPFENNNMEELIRSHFTSIAIDLIERGDTYYGMERFERNPNEYHPLFRECTLLAKTNSDFIEGKKLELRTLRRELNLIIDIERTGEKAFKKLNEAGLDLSDFKSKEQEHLPQVIKLTNNINILND